MIEILQQVQYQTAYGNTNISKIRIKIVKQKKLNQIFNL